jgi:hypothetical protein
MAAQVAGVVLALVEVPADSILSPPMTPTANPADLALAGGDGNAPQLGSPPTSEDYALDPFTPGNPLAEDNIEELDWAQELQTLHSDDDDDDDD